MYRQKDRGFHSRCSTSPYPLETDFETSNYFCVFWWGGKGESCLKRMSIFRNPSSSAHFPDHWKLTLKPVTIFYVFLWWGGGESCLKRVSIFRNSFKEFTGMPSTGIPSSASESASSRISPGSAPSTGIQSTGVPSFFLWSWLCDGRDGRFGDQC